MRGCHGTRLVRGEEGLSLGTILPVCVTETAGGLGSTSPPAK